MLKLPSRTNTPQPERETSTPDHRLTDKQHPCPVPNTVPPTDREGPEPRAPGLLANWLGDTAVSLGNSPRCSIGVYVCQAARPLFDKHVTQLNQGHTPE